MFLAVSANDFVSVLLCSECRWHGVCEVRVNVWSFVWEVVDVAGHVHERLKPFGHLK